MLDKLQIWLDRINARWGSVGAVIAVLFWMFILYQGLAHMLGHS